MSKMSMPGRVLGLLGVPRVPFHSRSIRPHAHGSPRSRMIAPATAHSSSSSFPTFPTFSIRQRAHLLTSSTSHRGWSGDSGVSTNAQRYDQLDSSAREKIDVYLDILLDWNTKMNLTAIRDRPSAITRHINDSLAILPAMDRAVALTGTDSSVRIVDVGSGAGLPGLVLATLRPEWTVTLLDSLNKRCTFNTAAAEAMGLENVEILWSRAEDAGTHEAYREQFDVATARAVAEVRTLAELCLPLIKVGGYWVAPKGPDPEDEVRDGLRAIETLGGEVDGLCIDQLGADDDGKPAFTVVTVRKGSSTPGQYPRKANAMKKRPL